MMPVAHRSIAPTMNAGADDYPTKPFSHRELIARIQAQLRRNALAAPQLRQVILEVGSITLNEEEHSLTRAGQPIILTPMEFNLLHYSMMNAVRVVTTRELLKEVWGLQDPGGCEVVRVTVDRLRQKIESDASRPRLLHTIPGVGVLLKPDTDIESA